MSDPHQDDGFTPEEQQKRDALLLRLLKTPPQPRPKRERGDKASAKSEKESSPRRKRINAGD